MQIIFNRRFYKIKYRNNLFCKISPYMQKITKNNLELSNRPQPLYKFDAEKFSPSLKLIKNLSSNTPTLKTIKKESEQTELSNQDKNLSNSIDSPQIEILPQKYYSNENTKLSMGNAISEQSEYSKNKIRKKSYVLNNSNKLSLSSSYLLKSYFGSNSVELNEFGEETEEKITAITKSNLITKFKKINQIASKIKLSNETYFSPYHITLFQKIISKADNFHKKETINRNLFIFK